MALASQTQFGPYQIIELVGAGGMGEVYKARDTRLDRTVALKILPPQGDRTRFEAEARAVAALNHPNIVAVYDVGENYIVSELIQGEPVPVPVEPMRKLIDLAVQIADGLAAAHTAGIIHRDLKPGNVLVTSDGRAKILDFGLAKIIQAMGADDGSTQAITTTQPGIILGTVAYMSPEQARGKPLDARTDQFSFGVMLYEMATGKRAFQRDTGAETITAILREDPEPLPASVPAPLRWIIERCLAKEPEQRYDSTRDLYQELRSLREHLSEAITTGAVPVDVKPPRRHLRWLAPAIGTVLLIAAGAFWLGRGAGRFEIRPRFTPIANDPVPETRPAFSPDGKSIVYVRDNEPDALSDTYQQIMVRSLDAPTPSVLVPGAPQVASLTWSPDGTRIYFLTVRRGLWSVTVSGEKPQLLLDSGGGAFGITPDGKTLLTTRDVEQTGGETRTVLFGSSPPGAEPKQVAGISIPADTSPAAGLLVFAADGSRFSLPCGTPDKLQICIVEYPSGKFHTLPVRGPTRAISWYPDSRHLLLNDRDSIQIIDSKSGATHTLLGTQEVYQQTTLSPDAERVIYSTGSANYDILELSLDGKTAHPMVEGMLQDMLPDWSPKGDAYAFIRNYALASELWTRSADGAHTTRLVKSNKGAQALGTPRYSPDARRIAYAEAGSLFTILVGGGRPIEIYQKKDAVIFGLAWAPDGNSIVFGERVGEQVHLLHVPSGGGQAVPLAAISQQSFYLGLHWSPDGRWIAGASLAGVHLLSPDGKIDKLLSEDAQGGDFSPDGKTFYALRKDDQHRWMVAPINVETGREGPGVVLPIPGPLYVGGVSVHPDGKRMAVHANELKYDLWMVGGFPRPEQGLARLWRSWINP